MPQQLEEAEYDDRWQDSHVPRGGEWQFRSLNVGPTGLTACFPDILPLLQNRPAVLFLQDVRLSQATVKRARRQLATFAPEYELFVNPVLRPTARAKRRSIVNEARTAIIMHRGWTYRAGIYDQKNLTNGNSQVQLMDNILVMHTTDPYTHSKGLWICVYNDTAAHPLRQTATLDSIYHIVERLEDLHDFVVIAGDWNASLDSRFVRHQIVTSDWAGRESPQIRTADLQFLQWKQKMGIKTISARTPTFSRIHNDLYHATLDYIFVKDKDSAVTAREANNLPSLEPKHDHKVLNCIVHGLPCSVLPTLRVLAPPKRIKRGNWDAKSELWKMTLQPPSDELCKKVKEGMDPLVALDALVHIMHTSGKEILGVSGGKTEGGVVRIPQSAAEKRHRRRVRRYNVTLQNLVSLGITGGKPTEAILSARDEGIVPTQPIPESFWKRVEPTAHRAVIEEWKGVMRDILQKEKDKYRDWEREQAMMMATLARDKAIERMDTPGSKEIKRWMGKMGATVAPVYMKTDYPDIIEIADHDIDGDLQHWCSSLQIKVQSRVEGTTTITELQRIPASAFHDALSRCAHLHPSIRCSDANRVVHRDSDKVVAWENFMAKEALATKTRCCCCMEGGIIPIVKIADKKREIVQWCTACRRFSVGVTRPQDYSADFLSDCLKSKVPPVWRDDERLSRKISWEDFLFYIKRLPRRKAPGPDEITSEMLQRAPEEALRVLYEAINKALSGESDLNTVFKNGNIFLLFKKGDYDDPRNYRPIVLLSLIYKILTAIVTDRLNHIAEKYNLLDDSQEGFRKLRSTSRQIQSLLWDREDAEARAKTLYLVYIDFKNAFNSMDLEAVWAWLDLMNVPDVTLLKNIYKDTFCQVDTPFGMSAPIFLTRGTKQGDCLSPLLFSLLFNTLLRQLSQLNEDEQVGFLNEMGKRTLHRAFADDLSLMTEEEKKMQLALKVVESFCRWSGMAVNALKSEASGWDFAKKLRLSTARLIINGIPLTQLDPSKPYKYLGILCSLTGSFQEEKQYIRSTIKNLKEKCKTHQYLTRQIVPVVCMLQESWFRYSAAICPWTEAELKDLYIDWIACVKEAWHISRSTAGAVFTFPEEQGGKTVRQPKAVMIQALMTHIQQLTNHEDSILERLRFKWRQIEILEGSDQEAELGQNFCKRTKLSRCPITRLLSTCSDIGVTVTLPTAITGSKEAKPTWISVGRQLQERLDRHSQFLSNEDSFTAAEQAFIADWIPRTIACRKVGYADICALRRINGCWVPPSQCLPSKDYDTLCNLFKRLPLQDISETPSQNDTEDIEQWTELVARDPDTVKGYLIVEHSIDWAIQKVRKTRAIGEDLRAAIRIIADKILPTPLLRDCAQVEQMYYDAAEALAENKKPLLKLLLMARGMHRNRLERSADARARYIDHISYRILRGLPFKPYKILNKKMENGAYQYEVQWVYSLPLPESFSYPRRYVGLETQATWMDADEHDTWSDEHLKNRLIAEYEESRRGGRKRPRAEPVGSQHTKRQATNRWDMEALSRAVQIQRTNVYTPNRHRDQWTCSSRDGLATVTWSDGITSRVIFKANQARLTRLFMDPKADLSTWKTWERALSSLENRNMILSNQLLSQLQRVLDAQCIAGLHPLVVPESFLEIHYRVNDLPQSTSAMGATLCIMSNRDEASWDSLFEWVEQQKGATWYVLTEKPTTVQNAWLSKRAALLRQFSKGEYILLQKQAWRKAHWRNRGSNGIWQLWGAKGTIDIKQIQRALQDVTITKDGRGGEREWTQEDMRFGPAADLYEDSELVIATDGSVQQDGSMGAAAAPLNDSLPEKLKGVGGNPSSTLAELSALQLAADMAIERPMMKNVIILTDSLTSLTILEDRQRQDFKSTRWHDDEIATTSDKLIQTLNSCAGNGQLIRLQKIKAHALEPLNERADELAEKASALPPDEIPGEQFRCLLSLPGKEARSWSSALARSLVQLIAHTYLERDMNPPVKEARVLSLSESDVVTPVANDIPKTNKWLLWRRAAREKLGSILRSKKYDRRHKIVTQAMTNSFPTQANLHIWNKSTTASCPLGCPENETFAHLQCYCTGLKAQRIAVHHKIWTNTVSMVQKCLPHEKFTFIPEATIPKILDAIDTSQQSSGDKEDLRRSISNIDWEPSQESPAEQSIAHGVQALSRITDCAVLPSSVKRPGSQEGTKSNKKGRSQPPESSRLKRTIEPEDDSRWVSVKCPDRRNIASTSSDYSQQHQQQHTQRPSTRKSALTEPRRRNRRIDRPFFPSLTNPSTTNYLSIMNRHAVPAGRPDGGNGAALGAQPMLPSPDLGRQRPDGVLINWKKKRLHVLEFTRPYDSRRTSLAKTNLYKLLKYEPLCRKISTALPSPWTTSVTAFAVGVRGTVDEPAWSTALRHLGINTRRHHDQIIKAVISSSLDAIYEMTEARQAALRNRQQSLASDVARPHHNWDSQVRPQSNL